MRGVNKVILIGAVGKDPEIKTLQSGSKLASFSFATSEHFKDREGVKQEKTQWHTITCFDPLASVVEGYVRKGSKLYIEGKIDYQQYEKDGEKKTFTKIIMQNMSFLDSKGEQTASGASKPASIDEFNDGIPF